MSREFHVRNLVKFLTKFLQQRREVLITFYSTVFSFRLGISTMPPMKSSQCPVVERYVAAIKKSKVYTKRLQEVLKNRRNQLRQNHYREQRDRKQKHKLKEAKELSAAVGDAINDADLAEFAGDSESDIDEADIDAMIEELDEGEVQSSQSTMTGRP